MTRIAVTGATGTMATAVRRAATKREDVTVTLLVSRSGTVADATEPVVTPDELGAALESYDVDVLVDFTVPSASLDVVMEATLADIPSVVGTTGFSDDQMASLRAMTTEAPVLFAPNFSRGIQTLITLLETALEPLRDYDIEITETHHNRKRDAPSGTAIRLVETIEGYRDATARVTGREGEAPRSAEEIGIHSRRAGSIAGEHEVLFAANDEVLELTHRAESRSVFAEGALDAAVWITGQAPGWYGFNEVVSP